jgi:hypothetical protein
MKLALPNHLSICVVMFGFLTFSHNSSAQFVELSADVEVRGGLGSHSSVASLRCVVGTNTWLMESDYTKAIKSTWWFTGTNLNELQTWIPGNSTGNEGTQFSRSFESRDGNPSRPPGTAGLLDGPQKRISWLAYCSSRFFKSKDRKFYPPSTFWMYWLSAPSEGFPHRFTLFQDDLGLPRSVGLYTTHNETIFHYRVDATTNVLGWEFPTEFALTEYKPRGDDCWQSHLQANGKLKTIRIVPELMFPITTGETGRH